MLTVETPPSVRHAWAAPAALLGLLAVVFGVPVVNSLRLAAGDTVAPPDGWADQLAAVEGAVFSGGVVLLVVCRWLPRHAPEVAAAIGLRWTSPARTVGGVLAYLVIATVSTSIASRLPDPVTDDPIGTGLGGRLVGIAAGISAGITEEIVLLALAAAVVGHALRDRPRLVLPLTLALLIVLRWSIHLQHGWASVFVLIWVPLAYALFRRVGSIWPLVIGHVVYDVVLVLTH